MRIVAGEFGGRRLIPPPDRRRRPPAVAARGGETRVAAHRGAPLRFAEQLAPGAFDLVFADPPYHRDDAASLVALFRRTPFARILSVEHPASQRLGGGRTR